MRLKIAFMAFLLIASSLCGCAAKQVANTRKQVLADPNLAADIRQAIQAHKIKIGMTKDQVLASWGNPCWYCPGTRKNSWGDTWEYNPFGTGDLSIGAGTYLFFDEDGRLTAWSQ
jgi:outer membrane protein assembly factor BamE